MANFIKTIMRFVRDIADDTGDAMMDVLRISNYDTLKEGAKNSMAIFPMIFSENITDPTINTIVKGTEREYASYLMLLLSSNDIIDIARDERKGDMLDRLGVTGNLGESLVNAEFFPVNDKEEARLLRNSHGGLFFENWKDLAVSVLKTLDEEYNSQCLNSVSISALTEDQYMKGGEFSRNMNSAKYSELQPTIMTVVLQYVNDNGVMQSTQFVFGVKAQPHLVTTEEMLINLKQAFKGGNFVFRAIKWLSGETRFFKDLILSAGDSKEHVAKLKDSKIKNLWFNLHMLRNVSKMRKALSTYPTLPTSTIIITMDEVKELKTLHAIDIFKPIYLNRVFNEMFINGFIIVDESVGSVKVYNYENATWIDYSLDYIQKENDMTNNLIKSIVDLTKR